MIAFVLLLALLLITRFPLGGEAFHLFDASWASFFLLGLWVKGMKPLLTGFLGLVFATLVVDGIALGLMDNGITVMADYCFTPAYAGLIVTYGCLTGLGLCATRFTVNYTHFLTMFKDLMPILGLSLFAACIAFITSNWFFYKYSGYFDEMSAYAYWMKVIPDYLPSYTLILTGYVFLLHGIMPFSLQKMNIQSDFHASHHSKH